MARYKVLRDCTWKNGYWKQDRVVEFGDDEKPPHHFELIDEKAPEVVKVAEPEQPKTFSEMNKAADTAKPKTGMAYTPPASAKATTNDAKSKPKAGKK